MRGAPGARRYAPDYDENYSGLNESYEEAARALLDPGRVTLQALSNELSPACVRRRLTDFLAGAPPAPRPAPKVTENPFERKQKSIMTPPYPIAYSFSRFHSSTPGGSSSTIRVTCVGQRFEPIVARIRQPRK